MNRTADAKAAAQRLKNAIGMFQTSIREDDNGITVKLPPAAVPQALIALKKDSQAPFDLLSDVTAVDWSTHPGKLGKDRPRFSVLYVLTSTRARIRLFLEADVAEGATVQSAAGLFASADWAEREVFDMFGIRFASHPDLRRVLLPDDFEGHPLLKEFPRQGMRPQDFPQE